MPGLIRVKGKQGAYDLPLEKDSVVLAVDTTAALVWLIRVDSGGTRACYAYDIAPHYDDE